MEVFFERLALRAATLDERLSDQFEPLPGQKADADLAARRLAAWCTSCASGDWSLYGRRLGRALRAIEPDRPRTLGVRGRARQRGPSTPWHALTPSAVLDNSRGEPPRFYLDLPKRARNMALPRPLSALIGLFCRGPRPNQF